MPVLKGRPRSWSFSWFNFKYDTPSSRRATRQNVIPRECASVLLRTGAPPLLTLNSDPRALLSPDARVARRSKTHVSFTSLILGVRVCSLEAAFPSEDVHATAFVVVPLGVTLGVHQVGTGVQTAVDCSRLLSKCHIGGPSGGDWSADNCRLLPIAVKVSHWGSIRWGLECRLL